MPDHAEAMAEALRRIISDADHHEFTFTSVAGGVYRLRNIKSVTAARAALAAYDAAKQKDKSDE